MRRTLFNLRHVDQWNEKTGRDEIEDRNGDMDTVKRKSGQMRATEERIMIKVE
jgi:hypothetical protein